MLPNTALRVYGRQAYARVEFERIKTDRKADPEAAHLETETLVAEVQAGWLTNDEAAQQSIGHDAVAPMGGKRARAAKVRRHSDRRDCHSERSEESPGPSPSRQRSTQTRPTRRR